MLTKRKRRKIVRENMPKNIVISNNIQDRIDRVDTRLANMEKYRHIVDNLCMDFKNLLDIIKCHVEVQISNKGNEYRKVVKNTNEYELQKQKEKEQEEEEWSS